MNQNSEVADSMKPGGVVMSGEDELDLGLVLEDNLFKSGHELVMPRRVSIFEHRVSWRDVHGDNGLGGGLFQLI